MMPQFQFSHSSIYPSQPRSWHNSLAKAAGKNSTFLYGRDWTCGLAEIFQLPSIPDQPFLKFHLNSGPQDFISQLLRSSEINSSYRNSASFFCRRLIFYLHKSICGLIIFPKPPQLLFPSSRGFSHIPKAQASMSGNRSLQGIKNTALARKVAASPDCIWSIALAHTKLIILEH